LRSAWLERSSDQPRRDLGVIQGNGWLEQGKRDTCATDHSSRRQHCNSCCAWSLVWTCRLTGEFIGDRVGRLGAIAVTTYELLFAHARSTWVDQQLLQEKWDLCKHGKGARVSRLDLYARASRGRSSASVVLIPHTLRRARCSTPLFFETVRPMSLQEGLQNAENKLATSSLSIPTLDPTGLSSLPPSSPSHMA